jgi:hypothetical protein
MESEGEMDNLIAGSLRIDAQIGPQPGPIRLLWQGKSNDRNPSLALAPYFSDVLATATVNRIPVEMHFEKLEHFNSSTITSIIQLVQDARACGVKLLILYDRELRWQRLSLEPLKVFANDLLELRSV